MIEELLDPSKGLYGCMLGRAAYENPWIFSDFDRRFYGVPNQNYSRREVLQVLFILIIYQLYAKEVDKIRSEKDSFGSTPKLVKPIMHLFTGEDNNKFYRNFLS